MTTIISKTVKTNVSQLISPQEWERRISNSATGELNHKLRSVLAVMNYYWEEETNKNTKKWTVQSFDKYVAGQNKIRTLLANSK